MQWIYIIKVKKHILCKAINDYSNKKVSKNVQNIKGVLQLLL